nr:glycosyltransferase family 4 protein [Rhodoblastus sphagnicola]
MFQRGSCAAAVKREFGLEGRFVAAYVGTHGMAHGLDTLLDAAAALKDDSGIAFLMVGDGADHGRLAARVASERLANVVMLGQLPKARMPDIWAATDASLILLKRSETFLKVLPSKTFEAMAMEVPIVLGVDGEAKALVEDAGAGLAIAPESAADLAAAVVRLRDDANFARALGRRGGAYVRAHFDRERLARRYIEALDAAVAAKGAKPDGAELRA